MGPRPAVDEEILALATAGDVAAALRRIFGGSLAARGVIHAGAVRQGDRGRYAELAPGPEAPRSHHATFLRGVARARADAILTTAAALRREPDLDHRLDGPGATAGALADWRRERLAKRQPPVTLVLAPAGVDLDHPVFRRSPRPVVYASRRAQWELESRAADRGVELVGVDEPTVAGAVDFLRHAFGAATLVLETPARDVAELCGPPARLDEVLLAIHRAPDAPADPRADPYPSAERLARCFRVLSRPFRVAAASGEWAFQRFRR